MKKSGRACPATTSYFVNCCRGRACSAQDLRRCARSKIGAYLLVPGLFCFLAASLVRAEIADATVEPAGAGRFHIAFHREQSDAPVSIFASHSPVQLEDATPVAVTGAGEADVDLRGWEGRAYFHLKTAAGAIRVVSIRRLPLQGQDNFRDLGGYRAAGGRHIRWGRLYRSGQLASLTESDYRYLAPLGIRLVCDFRADDERTRQATHWPGNAPEFFSTPIGVNDGRRNARLEEMKKLLAEEAPPERMRAFMKSVYPDMPMNAAPQFRNVLDRLLAVEGASMVHCSAGKDRTGVFSALLLLVLGVDHETVIQDYMLTNQYTLSDDSIIHTASAYQRLLGLDRRPAVELLRPLMSVDRSYIEAALESITTRYGNFGEYRRKKLDFSDAQAEALRVKYLEP